MDEFNNNDEQGYDSNLYGQPSQGFNDQPNEATQFGGTENTYGGQPQVNQYNPNANQTTEKKGLSIASMVLGILSMTCCCGGIGLLMGIAAIIMGAIGKKQGGRVIGIAGILCGSIGIVVSLIYLLLYALGMFSSYESYL